LRSSMRRSSRSRSPASCTARLGVGGDAVALPGVSARGGGDEVERRGHLSASTPGGLLGVRAASALSAASRSSWSARAWRGRPRGLSRARASALRRRETRPAWPRPARARRRSGPGRPRPPRRGRRARWPWASSRSS
jgi:hypothetical protein